MRTGTADRIAAEVGLGDASAIFVEEGDGVTDATVADALAAGDCGLAALHAAATNVNSAVNTGYVTREGPDMW